MNSLTESLNIFELKLQEFFTDGCNREKEKWQQEEMMLSSPKYRLKQAKGAFQMS